MKRRFISISFFPVLFFLTVLILFILWNRFKIKTAIVISEQTNIFGLESMNNQNLFVLNIDNLQRNLLKANPSLSSASVVKRYPNRVIIFLQFRTPIAQIFNNSIRYYLDRDGIFLTNIKIDRSLPIVNASEINISPGDIADWRIKKSAILLEDIAQQSISVGQITIDDTAKIFLINLANDTRVVIPYAYDALKAAASLQMIISRFRIEGKFAKEIDFRYDKPVVTVSNGEKISSSL